MLKFHVFVCVWVYDTQLEVVMATRDELKFVQLQKAIIYRFLRDGTSLMCSLISATYPFLTFFYNQSTSKTPCRRVVMSRLIIDKPKQESIWVFNTMIEWNTSRHPLDWSRIGFRGEKAIGFLIRWSSETRAGIHSSNWIYNGIAYNRSFLSIHLREFFIQLALTSAREQILCWKWDWNFDLRFSGGLFNKAHSWCPWTLFSYPRDSPSVNTHA